MPEEPRPAAAHETAVELDGVARRYGRRWALRGVSMRIAAGEVVGVLGPNGSGKTTLLRVLATSLRPTRGTGRVFGLDLVADAGAIRAEAAYLGHATALYPDLTAHENLRFAARMAGRPKASRIEERVLDVLTEVGLGAAATSRVRTFSSGMKRRLAIGRLMLLEPRLLLLDEPYSSLDGEAASRLNMFIRAVRDRGGAVLIATHGAARAAPVLDRAVHLERGRRTEGVGSEDTAHGVSARSSADEPSIVGSRAGFAAR